MFPTTIWTTIREAGANDAEALERFARDYRGPVLRFVAGRGFEGGDAEDLCQDVFLRILNGGVLARADAARGRFRSLLLSVVKHAIADRLRRRGETPEADLEPADRDPDFDREWVLELSERALLRLREEGSPYYQVLREHLEGRPQDRNKLWIARRKLRAFLRHEVALTCSSPAELEGELAYLSGFLRPEEKP